MDNETITHKFLAKEISAEEFEITILNNSDWDGNKPADKFWILLEAYRKLVKLL